MKIKLERFPELAGKATEYSKDAAALVEIIKTMEDGVAKTDLIRGYMDSLKVVFIAICGLSAAGLAASLLVRGMPLDRALETEQGYRREKGGEGAEEKN